MGNKMMAVIIIVHGLADNDDDANDNFGNDNFIDQWYHITFQSYLYREFQRWTIFESCDM